MIPVAGIDSGPGDPSERAGAVSARIDRLMRPLMACRRRDAEREQQDGDQRVEAQRAVQIGGQFGPRNADDRCPARRRRTRECGEDRNIIDGIDLEHGLDDTREAADVIARSLRADEFLGSTAAGRNRTGAVQNGCQPSGWNVLPAQDLAETIGNDAGRQGVNDFVIGEHRHFHGDQWFAENRADENIGNGRSAGLEGPPQLIGKDMPGERFAEWLEGIDDLSPAGIGQDNICAGEIRPCFPRLMVEAGEIAGCKKGRRGEDLQCRLNAPELGVDRLHEGAGGRDRVPLAAGAFPRIGVNNQQPGDQRPRHNGRDHQTGEPKSDGSAAGHEREAARDGWDLASDSRCRMGVSPGAERRTTITSPEIALSL